MSATEPPRRLEAAGFTREQAEAILDAQASEAATREDLANLKAEIFKFLVTGLAVQAGVIVALVKLL